MSKEKVQKKSEKATKREAAEGKKMFNFVAVMLLVLFVLIFVAYAMFVEN